MNAPAALEALSSGLSEEAQARAQRCWERLYREHFNYVRATLTRFGVAAHALDDVAQLVFIKVRSRVHTLDPEASERAWLYGFARRVAANDRRKRARHEAKLRAACWIAGTYTRSTQDASPQTERWVTNQYISSVLAQLPEIKRDVLVLSDLWGMTNTEVAELLEINANTVRSRLHAARKSFRQLVEQTGIQLDHRELLASAQRAGAASPERCEQCFGQLHALLALVGPLGAWQQLGGEPSSFDAAEFGGDSTGTTNAAPSPSSAHQAPIQGFSTWARASLLVAAGVGALAFFLVPEPEPAASVMPPTQELSSGLNSSRPQAFPDLGRLAARLPQAQHRSGGPSVSHHNIAHTNADAEAHQRIAELLAKARKNVQGGKPHQALANLDELARIPGSRRIPAAVRWRMEALCQVGRFTEAEAVGKRETALLSPSDATVEELLHAHSSCAASRRRRKG